MRAILLLPLLALPELAMALENRSRLYDFDMPPVVEDLTRPGGAVNRDQEEARRQDMLNQLDRVMRGEITMEDSIREYRQKWHGGTPPGRPQSPFRLRGQEY